MIQSGVLEIDVHGMRVDEAKRAIDKLLLSAGGSVYRVRVIHGYHGGNGIKSMVREEYSYSRSDKVVRVEGGSNQGITELVLREYF